MSLIKSISGIRGTIGGAPGDNLTPIDVVKFAAAYGMLLKEANPKANKIIIGRDARLSGEIITQLVSSTLMSQGYDIIDLGLSTTPTVEIAVPMEKADGGIILTASHNPAQWNALKLLNNKGEFISGELGEKLLDIANNDDFSFVDVKKLGKYTTDDSYLDKHIEMILKLDLVDVEAIKKSKFRVVVDAVNSSGGIAVPKLLKALGVTQIKELNCEPTGHFAHNPEPLPENLLELSQELRNGDYDLGIVVDPDVDRLAFITENGEPFGEEYTLVAVADYILKNRKNTEHTTVSNLSSTIALREVTEKHGGKYFASAVGEVNVVEMMKKHHSIIGGEGNGGIILPELHYGRDALVGIALFLSHLAHFGKSIGVLRKSYPDYYIAKKKIELDKSMDVDGILSKINTKYQKQECDTQDGLKIYFGSEWVHLRKSNTEPIIRIYAESEFETTANSLADKIIHDIKDAIRN
ncbi:phosphomannomutase [Spirosomataceae bacterium TFI 002]|nr:phosphomannomutase [Spirosomataceae bacterium TFI 002]